MVGTSPSVPDMQPHQPLSAARTISIPDAAAEVAVEFFFFGGGGTGYVQADTLATWNSTLVSYDQVADAMDGDVLSRSGCCS